MATPVSYPSQHVSHIGALLLPPENSDRHGRRVERRLLDYLLSEVVTKKNPGHSGRGDFRSDLCRETALDSSQPAGNLLLFSSAMPDGLKVEASPCRAVALSLVWGRSGLTFPY